MPHDPITTTTTAGTVNISQTLTTTGYSYYPGYEYYRDDTIAHVDETNSGTWSFDFRSPASFSSLRPFDWVSPHTVTNYLTSTTFLNYRYFGGLISYTIPASPGPEWVGSATVTVTGGVTGQAAVEAPYYPVSSFSGIPRASTTIVGVDPSEWLSVPDNALSLGAVTTSGATSTLGSYSSSWSSDYNNATAMGFSDLLGGEVLDIRIGAVTSFTNLYPSVHGDGSETFHATINGSLEVKVVLTWYYFGPPNKPSTGGISTRVDRYESRFGTITCAAWFTESKDGLKHIFVGRHLNPVKDKGSGAGSTDGWTVYSPLTVDARSDLGLCFLPDGRLVLTYDTFSDLTEGATRTPHYIVSKQLGLQDTWSAPSTFPNSSQIIHQGRGEHSQASTFKLRVS